MLESAVLSAHSSRNAGSISLEPHLILLPGNDVGFSSDLREPKTVNDVRGVEAYPHRDADGKVNLVRGGEGELGTPWV
jgi:hypothetical protein